MKYSSKWEKFSGSSYRLKVPNGWIVETMCYNGGVSQIFIEDKNHEWELEHE